MARPTTTELQDLRQRWEENPGSRLFLQLAEAHRKRDEHEKAIQVLERGLEHRPNDLSGMVALGRCRLELGEAAVAAELLETVVERDPAHMVASKLLVEAYLQLGDADRATERLQFYRLLNDRDPEIESLERRLRKIASAPTPGDLPEGDTETLVVEELVAQGDLVEEKDGGDAAADAGDDTVATLEAAAPADADTAPADAFPELVEEALAGEDAAEAPPVPAAAEPVGAPPLEAPEPVSELVDTSPLETPAAAASELVDTSPLEATIGSEAPPVDASPAAEEPREAEPGEAAPPVDERGEASDASAAPPPPGDGGPPLVAAGDDPFTLPPPPPVPDVEQLLAPPPRRALAPDEPFGPLPSLSAEEHWRSLAVGGLFAADTVLRFGRPAVAPEPPAPEPVAPPSVA
ncbi:MAG: tetratricopeptide repeat protein, partial [Acidobacteria bacterium]